MNSIGYYIYANTYCHFQISISAASRILPAELVAPKQSVHVGLRSASNYGT